MKNRIILCLSLIVIFATSCDKETIRVSGEVVRTEVNISGYSGLRVSNAFHVNVAFSDNEEKIIVEANEDIQDRIAIRKEGDYLIVKLKNQTNIRGNATLNVFITTRNIHSYDVSGASNITLDNPLSAQRVALKLSGASMFTGELFAEELEVNASGASDVDIFGSASNLDALLEGASNLRDYDLLVNILDIRLSGASTAFLSVAEKIDISASGASILNYKGNAIIDSKELSGASEIHKTDN